VKAARDKGLLKSPKTQEPKPSISSLYDARGWVARLHPGKIVHEFETTTDKGKTLKTWEIADENKQPATQAQPEVGTNDEDWTTWK
jgi:hypothetical protein